MQMPFSDTTKPDLHWQTSTTHSRVHMGLGSPHVGGHDVPQDFSSSFGPHFFGSSCTSASDPTCKILEWSLRCLTFVLLRYTGIGGACRRRHARPILRSHVAVDASTSGLAADLLRIATLMFTGVLTGYATNLDLLVSGAVQS